MSDDQQDRNDQNDQPAEPSMNDLLRQAWANGRTRMPRPRDEAGRFVREVGVNGDQLSQAPPAEPGGFGGGRGGMTGEGGPPRPEDTMTELIRDAVWGRRR